MVAGAGGAGECGPFAVALLVFAKGRQLTDAAVGLALLATIAMWFGYKLMKV